MIDLSDTSLLDLNAKGLIPGPGEKSEDFYKRAAYCLNLHTHLSEEIKTALNGDGKTNSEILNPVNDQLKKLYDCAPRWIPLFFTNHKLPFWQGGCAWIFQMTEHSPIASLIQLRKEFATKSKYLGIYQRDELLRHELCHVGRMAFDEPKYEEIIAYRSADSRFRRFFGPLMQSSIESALFLLLLFMIVVFDVFLIALNRPDAYTFSLWLKALPLLLIGGAIARLWVRQSRFNSCLKHIEECIGHPRAAYVTFRLTDKEIEAFAKMSPESIREYASVKKDEELRWQGIWKAYF